MSAPVNLQVPVDGHADPLDLVQDALVGTLNALDGIDGVTFGGVGASNTPASRRTEATVVASGQTLRIVVTTERTA